MALRRLIDDNVYRFYVFSPLAFNDWQNPTTAELNANPTNDPHGLAFNITCAVNRDGTTYNLGDPETDDSLSFCQVAGTTERMAENPEIALEIFRSRDRWVNGDSTLASDGFNSANLAFSLLAARDVEYFVVMSIGKGEDEPFAVGDRLKMARVATDWGVDVMGTGENIRLSNDFANRGDVNWNYVVAA